MTSPPSAISVPAGGSWRRRRRPPDAGVGRAAAPGLRLEPGLAQLRSRASGTRQPGHAAGRTPRSGGPASHVAERPRRARAGRAPSAGSGGALLEGGLGASRRAPRRAIATRLAAAQPAARGAHLEPGDDLARRGRRGRAAGASSAAARARPVAVGRASRSARRRRRASPSLRDAHLGVRAAAGAQLARAQLERDDGVRGDAARARAAEPTRRPRANATTRSGHSAALRSARRGTCTVTSASRCSPAGTLDGARVDLGPAGGHALDGELERARRSRTGCRRARSGARRAAGWTTISGGSTSVRRPPGTRTATPIACRCRPVVPSRNTNGDARRAALSAVQAGFDRYGRAREDRARRRLRLRAALRARRVRDVRRAQRRVAAEHAGAGHADNGLEGWGETCPLGPDLPRGARRRRARGAARARPRAARRRPAQPQRGRTTRMDGALRGHAYAKAARRHRLLGPARPRARRPRQHAARRRALARFPALRRDPARPGGGDGRARARPPRRGRPPLPAQARRRPARGRRAACGPCSRRTSTSWSPTPTAAGACRTR